MMRKKASDFQQNTEFTRQKSEAGTIPGLKGSPPLWCQSGGKKSAKF